MQSFNNKDQKKKKNSFLIQGWLGFFVVVVKVRAFTVVVLKILAFRTLKSYFIYITTSLYNIPNIKCSIFLPLHLK